MESSPPFPRTSCNLLYAILSIHYRFQLITNKKCNSVDIPNHGITRLTNAAFFDNSDAIVVTTSREREHSVDLDFKFGLTLGAFLFIIIFYWFFRGIFLGTCPHCGHSRHLGARFCAHCGHRYEE